MAQNKSHLSFFMVNGQVVKMASKDVTAHDLTLSGIVHHHQECPGCSLSAALRGVAFVAWYGPDGSFQEGTALLGDRVHNTVEGFVENMTAWYLEMLEAAGAVCEDKAVARAIAREKIIDKVKANG